jgi:hypothetical protein
MTLVQILPVVAAASAALALSFLALRTADARMKSAWVFPALLCILFLGWSLYASLSEGPTGFWPEHIRNLWGNQIWFDLLLAVGIGFALILPRAKAQSMRVFPWLVFILLTGCIGFSAMFARLLFLEEKSQSVAT